MRFRENMRKYSELILQKMHRILLLMALMLLSAMTLGTTSWAKEVVDLKTVVLGNSHGCGITHGGALRCFGNNGAGQLGIDQKLPYSFARHGLTVLPSGVSNVAISDDHTCALVSNSLYCWGSNTYGQLGTGKSGENIRTPTQVFAMSAAVTAIAAGGSTTCAILTPNGTLQCWGRNDLGQVGNGTVSPMVLAPFTVIPSGATAVAVGAQHACAVVDGGLQCWGFLLFKDEGLKTLNRPTSIIAPGQGVTAVAAALHTCVIVKGALQCWGRNFHGQIGVPAGARIALGVPTTIVASGVNAMALSNENTCAVAHGTLKCWGWNNHAQLGAVPSTGSATPIAIPVSGAPPSVIRSIAIGMRQVCVLTGEPTNPAGDLLQCTNRAPDPDDVDDTKATLPPEKWLVFGAEGVGLSEPPPVMKRIVNYGLWKGTIGTQSVMVQLAPTAQACDARYYYHRHSLSIPLVERERRQGMVWIESPETSREASWNFADVLGGTRNITGEWISKDGRRRLPIRLSLQKLTPSTVGDDGKPRYLCDTHEKAFTAPRVSRAMQERKLAVSDTTFAGVDGSYRYREVLLMGDRIESLAMPESVSTPQLKQMLRDWEGESVSQYFECAFGLSSYREEISAPDFSRGLAPVQWSAKLLVLREIYSNYCGGAHPNGGVSDFKVWDLVQDRPVAVWRWFKGIDKTSRISSKRLRDLVAAHYSRRDETGDNSCADALDGNEYYLMYPTSTGMVFSPVLPHVNQACIEDIEVPWVKLHPFLSPMGQKERESLVNIQ